MEKIRTSMKFISVLLAYLVLLMSCASTTTIHSKPGDAKIYVDGEPVGRTPYSHRDTKIIGSCTNVRLEKEGYQMFSTEFCRDEEADVGAIIGGIFFLVPFLWLMKYKPTHTYELVSDTSEKNEISNESPQDTKSMESKADRLREIKKLLDEGILTEGEYQNEKKKILAED